MASTSRAAMATARVRVFDELVEASDPIDTCMVPKIPMAMIDSVTTSSIIVKPSSVATSGRTGRLVLERVTRGVGRRARRGGDRRGGGDRTVDGAGCGRRRECG